MTCTDKAAEIKPGDAFDLTYTVKEVGVDSVGGCLCQRTDGSHVYLDKAVLAAGRRVARPLGIGDRVKHRSGCFGTIGAIDGKWAWLRSPDDMPLTVALSDLERAPDTKEGA